jgi:translation elongation factor EF-Tu-like GTPase
VNIKLKPQFIAHLKYKATKEGGRKGYAFSGIRPDVLFKGKARTCGMQTFLGGIDKVEPGGEVDAEIVVICAAQFKNHLYPGLEFEFSEGAKVTGTGVVIRVLDSELEYKPETLQAP